jgi:hypothetical protein
MDKRHRDLAAGAANYTIWRYAGWVKRRESLYKR